ncbi:hypothetical protein V7x_37420 [Crateriforma conspicua]|uniref:Uncharacterized protein n=1 Tax=Crateriforma conspicua TaxID=2527996 RepID=A0A5C6FNQ8_9PLAN|nr:hypothetical protein V7x_37420 [Crateriforma conspicua]
MVPVNDRRKPKTDALKRLNNHFVQAQNTATAGSEYMLTNVPSSESGNNVRVVGGFDSHTFVI